MNKYAVCDKRADFLHDLRVRASLDDTPFIISEVTNGKELTEKDFRIYEKIVLCENMLDEMPAGFEKWVPSTQFMGYCVTKDGIDQFCSRNIPCVGMVTSSAQLLVMLMGLPKEKADAEAALEKYLSSTDQASAKEVVACTHELIKPDPVPEQASRDDEGVVSRLHQMRESGTARETDLLLKREREAAAPRKTAITVTIASGKGGVGKTTIATELACCMALTSHGRGRFKTCIIDFDIGLGDVGTILNFSSKGPTISDWIDDIRLRTSAGEKIGDILYTEREIESFLRKKDETGLYALLAPKMYTDSLDFTSAELEVIMRSLKTGAGFHFLIYDTGNSLQDPTLLALDKAEYVLLVATQDISCAHCLDVFLRTLQTIRFDLGKCRLILNNVMSAKETGISVAELQDSFDYPCIAKIRYSTSIIHSNNYGRPVVFSASHDMTKQMRTVVRYLNEGRELHEEQPKKFWKKLAGKEAR